ncbi:tumor necrosis factor receptor superfamily member 14-like [Acipenser ruthenus]|uniref:tumor necrosis factor receptor superfamily member 14-like n=1 Tax=Acipenser ruthenus TaxID=7906 RepID=UPI00274038D4|nr:tumor necrosis factor receptor superfamily member 14-like [Acipenser ruthenus]XP_058857844.1 tumor necrosis factor receptor superfamily member 14-like [Acipenser ruthenus]XP_058857845.1 tumor necrosis factor receptor superfamily member 14-like [Acipenser ruthenus]XP_058857846.1 tumor necrosis factor receptor superfamily member 14-like [Acipenser ruthenus]XP_058857847.1 tumor necrosis factor receptor superfamily member 14-like [Acipenser ruthenus]XP_058857848.1 tumor necrosis factor receptor
MNKTMFVRAPQNRALVPRDIFLRGVVEVCCILLLVFVPKISACEDAEYNMNGQCCPMCQAGMRVDRHCTADSSTSCIPCRDSTYTEKPNSLDRCRDCRLCDSEMGLTVVRDCTVFSDTICTCIDGFHCLDSSSSGCKTCQKHRSCSPGQYIKKKGSSIADTECEDCPDKTYSDGSLETCAPHTDCQSEGLAKPGTRASDTECKQPSAFTAVIAGTVVGVIALIGVIALVYKHMNKNKGDNMETEKGKRTYTPVSMTNGTDSVTVSVENTPGHGTSSQESSSDNTVGSIIAEDLQGKLMSSSRTRNSQITSTAQTHSNNINGDTPMHIKATVPPKNATDLTQYAQSKDVRRDSGTSSQTSLGAVE